MIKNYSSIFYKKYKESFDKLSFNNCNSFLKFKKNMIAVKTNVGYFFPILNKNYQNVIMLTSNNKIVSHILSLRNIILNTDSYLSENK